jgi:hypothetical protein
MRPGSLRTKAKPSSWHLYRNNLRALPSARASLREVAGGFSADHEMRPAMDDFLGQVSPLLSTQGADHAYGVGREAFCSG